MDLDDPSTTTITLRRSRRLTNKQEEHQPSQLSCQSSSTVPQSSSIPLAKTYPLRSRLRRASLTTPHPTSTTAAHRLRSSKQSDLLSTTLSSMGLRNGKIVNLRSIISGSTPSTAQEITTSTLPLLAFNPLPRHPSPPTTTTTATTTNSTTSSSSPHPSTQINNNNNNNNNDLTLNLCQYHYSEITNHPSLEANKHFPVRLDILLDRPPASREKQIEYGWNHDDRSMNIFVKHNDPCTFHRHVSLAPSLVQHSDPSSSSLPSSPSPRVPMLFVARKASPVVFMSGKSSGKSVVELHWASPLLFFLLQEHEATRDARSGRCGNHQGTSALPGLSSTGGNESRILGMGSRSQ